MGRGGGGQGGGGDGRGVTLGGGHLELEGTFPTKIT